MILVLSAVAGSASCAHAQNTQPTITAISGSGVDGSGNLTMNEDGDVTVSFTVADAQTAGGSLTVSGTRTNTTLFPSIGTSSSHRLRFATVSGGNRSLRVRPAANLHGSSSVSITVTDAGGLTASATFTITVNSIYDPPNLKADNLFAPADKTSTFDLFRNDAAGAESGQTFMLHSYTQPASGLLLPGSLPGHLRFTPASGFIGPDTFTYTVIDNTGAQVSTTGYITVGGHYPLDLVHTDLRVRYSGGDWFSEVRADLPFGSPNAGGGSNPTVLDFDEAMLLVNAASYLLLPANLDANAYSFLGRAPGESLYLLPQSQDGDLLWPGISTESIASGTFASYAPVGDPRAVANAEWMRCELVTARTPPDAVFSMFQSSTTPVVFWDSIDGINGPDETTQGNNVSDTFWVTSGTHAHMNWTFTHTGRYEFDVRWKALVNEGGNLVEVTSPVSTLHFMVFDGPTPPVTGPMTEAPPLAVADSITLNQDSSITLDVRSNDSSSPDMDEAMVVTAVTQGTHGSVSFTSSSVSYDPAQGFSGSDCFTYTLMDEHGGTAFAVVSVSVTPVGISLWRQTNFGSTANAGMGADAADSDQDGVVNLVEYALGLSPLAATTLPSAIPIAGQFGFIFDQPPGVSGITYGAEWTRSLGSNDWQPVANTGTPPQLRFVMPMAGEDRLFLRLKITR